MRCYQNFAIEHSGQNKKGPSLGVKGVGLGEGKGRASLQNSLIAWLGEKRFKQLCADARCNEVDIKEIGKTIHDSWQEVRGG